MIQELSGAKPALQTLNQTLNILLQEPEIMSHLNRLPSTSEAICRLLKALVNHASETPPRKRTHLNSA